jgi:hypothetical protein
LITQMHAGPGGGVRSMLSVRGRSWLSDADASPAAVNERIAEVEKSR